MRAPIFQVDAFTGQLFRGNPAAVVLLPRWLPDPVLRSIAAENNLSETAFLVSEGDGWAIRWFTPEIEVDLCGHATLASGWVVLHRLVPGRERVTFRSPAGPLLCEHAPGGRLAIELPSRPASPIAWTPALEAALAGAPVVELLAGRDVLAVLPDETAVRDFRPDLAAVARLDALGLIVTAPGAGSDFVSRYFAPQAGIDEDPVTGSAHCALAPYWAARLGRKRLTAIQLSRRIGWLEVEDRGDAVRIEGQAVRYLEGSIEIPEEPAGPESLN